MVETCSVLKKGTRMRQQGIEEIERKEESLPRKNRLF